MVASGLRIHEIRAGRAPRVIFLMKLQTALIRMKRLQNARDEFFATVLV